MLLEELLRDEREIGKMEGKIEDRQNFVLRLLEGLGKVPEDLVRTIQSESNLDTLCQYIKKALEAPSVEHFQKSIQ